MRLCEKRRRQNGTRSGDMSDLSELIGDAGKYPGGGGSSRWGLAGGPGTWGSGGQEGPASARQVRRAPRTGAPPELRRTGVPGAAEGGVWPGVAVFAGAPGPTYLSP